MPVPSRRCPRCAAAFTSHTALDEHYELCQADVAVPVSTAAAMAGVDVDAGTGAPATASDFGEVARHEAGAPSSENTTASACAAETVEERSGLTAAEEVSQMPAPPTTMTVSVTAHVNEHTAAESYPVGAGGNGYVKFANAAGADVLLLGDLGQLELVLWQGLCAVRQRIAERAAALVEVAS